MNPFKLTNNKMYNEDDLQTLYSTFFITLFTTRLCNLNCDYCDVICRGDKKQNLVSVDEFHKLIDFILYQEKDRPNINLHFFGGEPTLNPALTEFSQIAKERLEDYNLNMLITTNLTRSEMFYEKLENVKIIASFHSDFIGDHKNWFDKAKYVKKKCDLHHVVMMVTDNNMDYIYDLYKEWSKEFKCVLVPIDQIYHTEEYIKFKQKIIENGNANPFEHDVEYVNFHDHENPRNTKLGIMCSSGIIIDESGDVSYCFPKFDQRVFNVFENPEYKWSHFHFCNQMCENCDREIIRSSIDFYNDSLKNREYTVNNKVLVQCNT